MITIVVIFNGCIAGVCLYVAWYVWRLRSILSDIADALVVAEYQTHRVLQNAPEYIGNRQVGTYQLRQHYRYLIMQLQQLQQVLALLSVGQLAWRQYKRNRLSRRSSFKSGFRTGFKQTVPVPMPAGSMSLSSPNQAE